MSTIKQGTHQYLDATGITDATGAQLDVTGFTVHAVARASHVRGPVIAEWHTSPTGSQGTATAGGAVTDRVRLAITPSQTTPWSCANVVVQAELTSPAPDQLVARIIDETFSVSPEAVTD